jgi:hypothetical protein
MMPINSVLGLVHNLAVLAIDFPMARERLCFRGKEG